jgi:hypothetical protein
MTPTEKGDMLKFLSEVVYLAVALMVLGPLFDWDPDDEEKYEKLRKKSGPMPLPGVAEDPRYPFRFGGYLENHALLLLMQIRNENEQFLPWPGYGLDDYVGLLNLKSIAIDPTIGKYVDIVSLLIASATDDPSAYYKRTVGPYTWQQQDGLKIMNYMLKTVGITGSAVDPIKAIKDMQGVKARN